MDRLKQLENLLEFGVDDEVGVDTKDLLLQEVFLESLKEVINFLETSRKDFNSLGLLHGK